MTVLTANERNELEGVFLSIDTGNDFFQKISFFFSNIINFIKN